METLKPYIIALEALIAKNGLEPRYFRGYGCIAMARYFAIDTEALKKAIESFENEFKDWEITAYRRILYSSATTTINYGRNSTEFITYIKE